MSATGYHHHTSDTGIIVTASTIGDLDDVGYSVIWRSGTDITDVLIVEHVDRWTPGRRFRSSTNKWNH